MPHTILCAVPGLGEHSGRYQGLAEQVVDDGGALVSLDLHGQGYSPGWRGCIDSYDSLLSEVAALVQLARGGAQLEELAHSPDDTIDRTIDLAQWPDDRSTPVCLYGHSMGGNLVLNTVMRGRSVPERLIASAPMLRAVQPPSQAFMRVARLLMICLPHYRLKAPIRKEYLTALPAEIEAQAQDPLIHRRISLRLGASLIDSGQWALANPQLLRQPCLMIHGTADRITDHRASIDFASRARAAGAPCWLKLYPDMLHDIHRDAGREQVLADILKWLRTGSPPDQA